MLAPELAKENGIIKNLKKNKKKKTHGASKYQRQVQILYHLISEPKFSLKTLLSSDDVSL